MDYFKQQVVRLVRSLPEADDVYAPQSRRQRAVQSYPGSRLRERQGVQHKDRSDVPQALAGHLEQYQGPSGVLIHLQGPVQRNARYQQRCALVSGECGGTGAFSSGPHVQ